MISASEIADRLNECAFELARELLPNGREAGAKWMFSGIADTGRSESAWVHLSGPRIGRWYDMGNAAPGEDRGDMLDLLRLKMGLPDAASAFAEAKRRLGIHDDWTPAARKPDPAEIARRAEEARRRAEARQAEADRENEARMRGARALWLKAAPAAGTPVEAYLRGRGIDLPKWPGSLRYHGEVWNRAEQVKMPAMVAMILRADGVQVGTHRTYLQACPRRGWTKIDNGSAKMVLGKMWGGFIPVAKGASGKPMSAMPDGEPVYVTEGIEDALVVAMIKPEARVVAAISLANMGAIVLPAAARRLILVCDRDQKHAAQEQLERAIAQQQARGVQVQMVMPPETVNGRIIKDMNEWWDALRANAREGRAA